MKKRKVRYVATVTASGQRKVSRDALNGSEGVRRLADVARKIVDITRRHEAQEETDEA